MFNRHNNNYNNTYGYNQKKKKMKLRVYLSADWTRSITIEVDKTEDKDDVIKELNTKYGTHGWHYASKYTGEQFEDRSYY